MKNRNYLKKILLLMAMLLVLFIFSGCSKEKVDTSKLNIVTSFYPIYIATANIVDGLENVELRNLTATTTGCLHDYQLTTANMVTLSNADVLVVNGGGMETFIDKALETYEDIKIINASENILEMHSEEVHAEEAHLEDDTEEHEGHNHEHGENAHIWVSLSMHIKQVENIRDELILLDPMNSGKYMENTKRYISKLTELKDKMHESLDNIEDKNIVTFHEAFEFFAEEFNLEIVAVIEREPGVYPSARDVANIIDIVRSKDVKAIFIEPQYSKSAADTIARETGVKVYTLDPVVTGELNKDAYLDIMNQNLKVLETALKNEV